MRKIFIPICAILLAGCYYDKEDELYPGPGAGGGGGGCDTANISYATDIKPIFDQYCALAGCHDATTRSFSHDLSDYQGSSTSANSGRLLGAIRQDPGFNPMPKGMAKLGDCEISKITAWVNAGAPQ